MLARNNHDTLVTVFGGSGFLGRHVVRALAKANFRIRVAVRRPELAGHLQPIGRVGQINAVQANIRSPQSVAAATRDASIIVNLVGILFERGRQSFDAVQADGAATVARAAAEACARLVHVSALGADPESPSRYAQSKARAEAAVLETVQHAVIFRPSVVFGQEDDFLNRFASLARFSPMLPLIGGGETRFQPVYVGDVADAVATAAQGNAMPGSVYELGGPDVRTFRQLMEFLMEVIGRRRMLLPIPFALADMQAAVLQLLPKPLLTRDQVQLLRTDTIVSDDAQRDGRTLEALGIHPRSMAAMAPTYLWRFRRAGQFENSSA